MMITWYYEGEFIVQGDNEQEYIIRLDPFNCTCNSFKYHSPRQEEFCKHIKFILEEIKGGK